MTSPTDLTILRDLPPGASERAAELYHEAFRAKLRPALGAGPRGRRLLSRSLHHDRLLCAVSDGAVVGVLGYHLGGRGAFTVTLRDVAATYSPWSAWLRVLLLRLLHRRPRPGELLLDGVCVDASVRGLGIGSALLDAATDLAREVGATSVRLSVVDTNPRARALYERLGFVAGRTEEMGALRHVYGFGAATEMVRPVPGVPQETPA